MARPSRAWVRKTYTVSPAAENAIAMRAAQLGIDPGTVIDILVWNAILKPKAAPGQPGALSNEVLERMFAEEVLPVLEDEGVVRKLANEWLQVISSESESANLKAVRNLINRWRRTRNVEKEYQHALITGLGDIWEPSFLRSGLVDLDWFQPERITREFDVGSS